MKTLKVAGMILLLFALLIPVSGLGITYVFPEKGFRYTEKDGERVLTLVNLSENKEFLESLGTTVEMVSASYIASGIAMEILPAKGGQVTMSVSKDPLPDAPTLRTMSDDERQAFIRAMTGSDLYELAEITDTDPPYIRVFSSAMYASMPVYTLGYMYIYEGWVYTLQYRLVGRELTEEDDALMLDILSRVLYFKPIREEATPEPQASAEPDAAPEDEKEKKAEITYVQGELELQDIDAVVYTGSVIIRGKGSPGSTVYVYEGMDQVAEGTADGEGAFTVSAPLKGTGEHVLDVICGEAEAMIALQYQKEPATIVLKDAAERVITGPGCLISGTTVPDATVFINGGGISTNVKANRNGVFNARFQLERFGENVLTLRAHAAGHSDYTTEVRITREMTERERIQNFRSKASNVSYENLAAEPAKYRGANLIYRGLVCEYTDYNGQPCALVCVNNPGKGVWKDPIYIVLDVDEVPEIGSIMTFYVNGEGILLPAAGTYTRSGQEEEAPVTRIFYMTER